MNIRTYVEQREKTWNRICLGIALTCAIIVAVWAVIQRGILVEARADRATEELEKQVLRFHVLANSDKEEDQRVKMEVKQEVLNYLKAQMDPSSNLDQTKCFVEDHLEELQDVAERTVRREGAKDSVEAEVVWEDFPRKTYGDVELPAGKYQALRIKIGEAKGHNWWCCLYPSLCFNDTVCGKVVSEDKEELAHVLDEDAYNIMTGAAEVKIRWFFLGDRR